MRLIIYNINSFGGGYAYAKEIFNSAEKSNEFEDCKFLSPINSPLPANNSILKILLTDQPETKIKFIRKCHFIYRSFINPYKLFKFLKKEKSSVVIFNDYDQLSSFFWSFLFKRLRSHHYFGIILHDPDRDNYFPVRRFSVYTMKKVMSIMDVAFYHGYLPVKSYYKQTFRKVEIPHGIYPAVPVDNEFKSNLISLKGSSPLIGILGNIRDEKNYVVIIKSLVELPEVKLLIAGAVANSTVPTGIYRNQIKALGLESRVIWIEKYMSDNEMATAIQACDIISLYYKETFTSQSGIINVVAPFKKKVIVSDTESSLKHVVSKYNLGIIAKPNDSVIFAESVKKLLVTNENLYSNNWDKYIQEYSWNENVRIIAETFKSLIRAV